MLELLQRHPAAIALTVILSLVTLAAGVSGTWYFINQLSAVSVSNAERLAEIRREQEAIRKELATQSLMLQAINQEQGSFNNLHGEHLWLASLLAIYSQGQTLPPLPVPPAPSKDD